MQTAPWGHGKFCLSGGESGWVSFFKKRSQQSQGCVLFGGTARRRWDAVEGQVRGCGRGGGTSRMGTRELGAGHPKLRPVLGSAEGLHWAAVVGLRCGHLLILAGWVPSTRGRSCSWELARAFPPRPPAVPAGALGSAENPAGLSLEWLLRQTRPTAGRHDTPSLCPLRDGDVAP